MNTASHSMKRRKRSFSHFCYFLSKILSLRSKFKALEVIAGEKNCSNIYPIVFSFISIGKNIRILQSQLMNFGALCFNPGPLCAAPIKKTLCFKCIFIMRLNWKWAAVYVAAEYICLGPCTTVKKCWPLLKLWMKRHDRMYAEFAREVLFISCHICCPNNAWI